MSPDARAAGQALDRSELGAVELPRPPLDDLPYRDLVRALVARQGFRLDFNRLEPGEALGLVCDQLLGPGTFVSERALLAQDIAALAALMGELVGARAAVALRTYFAPGDLVWHVDRVHEARAFRLVWPLGRPAGMRVTSRDNIDRTMFRAYMHREHPLLGRLDTRVARTGADVETLWAHRPAQLEAMRSGSFPFLIDPGQVHEITPGAASIHCVETPSQPGTYHRSAWANRHAPGLQIVVTGAAG
ncbi:hypothetical protein RZN05_17605 [Sphingomonas sp. HF-S4]|uniref:Prolyl 4-hydroxylase alpha subunit Fe(2+) 2OG dioxygenase domain-containing protein n=1 Tax=Sphingomonas agrestis TaxID=3080540 RepID=A0ABU3YCF5_9SPHN|nr:hypothetical protein [Sphingomonas sp. HF-S4]MDV3458817.1 hypothetical protein [Sphingomonas sp. HF-S4]